MRSLNTWKKLHIFLKMPLQDKAQIKDLKKKLKKLKQQNAQTGPKFIEIQKSYLEINSQLKKSNEEKADLIKSQSTENSYY